MDIAGEGSECAVALKCHSEPPIAREKWPPSPPSTGPSSPLPPLTTVNWSNEAVVPRLKSASWSSLQRPPADHPVAWHPETIIPISPPFPLSPRLAHLYFTGRASTSKGEKRKTTAKCQPSLPSSAPHVYYFQGHLSAATAAMSERGKRLKCRGSTVV